MDDQTLKLTDSSGQEWSLEETQALVNQVGSLTLAADRMGVKLQILRDFGAKSPTEYVASKSLLDPSWLPKFVLMLGSIEDTANHFNVSTAFLEGILKSLGWEVRLPIPDKEIATKALKRFGSILYVARLLNSTPSLVKKAIPDWKQYVNPTLVGNTSIKTGTIAEKYYEQLRGSMILDSPANRNRNHPGWDYLDKIYGKVNVKGIPVNPRGKWTWEIDVHPDCEAYALVQLNELKVPVGMVILTKNQLSDPPIGLLSTPRSNNDIAISTLKRFEYSPLS